MAEVKIGLVTVSDRASQGIYEDKGGPAMLAEMSRILRTAFVPVQRVIADEQPHIETTLRELADVEHCCLILTTGGTGPARRDVTPEATAAVCERILDGFGEQMRAVSLKVVPTAILSRQIAGTRGKALIINLPGNPPAIKDCLEAVMPAVPYCIDLMEGPWLDFREDCGLKAFRPKHAKKPGA
ncbi:molybdopterin adenylyltransferase [bacterium]|nr:MAG: molybdopterin adenylyltransferase [bacterium]RIK62781.1 MAG: molybdopterin adenylyltransferase [Planctomycetota bacterium]